jgi:hypothetical protein
MSIISRPSMQSIYASTQDNADLQILVESPSLLPPTKSAELNHRLMSR